MYVIIWEFHVNAAATAEFEQAYSSAGRWATFFQSGHGYLGSELLKKAEETNIYLTIDRWQCQEDYEHFRNFNLDTYATIDQECEIFTEQEIRLGAFQLCP
jgi:heme-degrading monooxygenase HmoA